MNAAEARAALVIYLQPDVEPVLTSGEVDALLTLARRADSDGNVPYPAFAVSRAYALGDVVVPITRNTYRYEVTTAGTSASSSPTWPTTSGDTVTSGSAVFTNVGSDNWVGTYDLYAAAAMGWRLKAAKIAAEFDFTTDGNSFDRSQKHKALIAQARQFERRVISTPVRRAVTASALSWSEDDD